MEAGMGRVLEQFAEHAKIDVDTIETELFAAIRALEVDPKNMTIDDFRQCMLIYLDEVFYGISPEKTQ
jgi:hypothetical protein